MSLQGEVTLLDVAQDLCCQTGLLSASPNDESGRALTVGLKYPNPGGELGIFVFLYNM